MLKVNYKLAGLFSLKKYKDANLRCQSYEYPTVYAIRSAILGSVIRIDGLEKAQELFEKIKKAKIYIAYPSQYNKQQVLQRRYANSYWELTEEEKLDSKIIVNNSKSTMGCREYVCMEDITIYISNSIPNLEMYLNKIKRLGTSESLVYLHSIEETNKLNNILVEWDGAEHCNTYEQYDWDNKIQFENVYMYSGKSNRNKQRRFLCCVKDIQIEDTIVS